MGIDEIRRPQKTLTYPLLDELGQLSSGNEAVLPFVVGILADVSGDGLADQPELGSRDFVEIDRDCFNDVMKRMNVRLNLHVENTIEANGTVIPVQLKFESLEDFEPANVAQQFGVLRQLLEKRNRLRDRLDHSSDDSTQGAPTTRNTDQENDFASPLDSIIDATEQAQAESSSGRSAKHSQPPGIVRIDRVLSRQLAVVLQAPEFKRLEAVWRGLWYLVAHTATNSSLGIELLNCSKQELLLDMQSTSVLDDSQIYDRLYVRLFDTGPAFNLLVGDYEFDHSRDDTKLLQNLSTVVASSFCPFIAGASSQLFGLEAWPDLSQRTAGDLQRLFEGVDYVKWNAIREADESRFVVLTLPRFLSPPPERSSAKVDEFDFDASASANHPSQHCWMNSAFVFAEVVTRAVSRDSLSPDLIGVEGGGRVDAVWGHDDESERESRGPSCAAEAPLDERLAIVASGFGLVTLASLTHPNRLAFVTANSIHRPKRYSDDEGTASEIHAANLDFVLTSARLVHGLVATVRDNRCRIRSTDLDTILNGWLERCTRDESPLVEGKVELAQQESPSHYVATIRLCLRPGTGQAARSLRIEIPLPSV